MTKQAVVFPGQGSQSVGMLKDIAEEYPIVQTTFSEASKILDYDLWELVLHGPAIELDKTIRTQPALLTAAYAVWQILQKKIQPDVMAGHSLGEYTALVCAKSISFKDAVKLVTARGEYMQQAVPVGEGALAVIVGLEDADVHALCLKAKQDSEVLSAVNFNSPGQVVIGGHTNAVQRALILANDAGARLAKTLSVSVPSHCILMKPAAERLAAFLSQIEIKTPVIPVLNNVDVAFYETPEAIRDGLTRQLFLPVRWVEIIQKFAKMGVSKIIECGPGKVLTGLNKRISSDMQYSSSSDVATLQTLLETTNESLGIKDATNK